MDIGISTFNFTDKINNKLWKRLRKKLAAGNFLIKE
jgi:hypothetical protein